MTPEGITKKKINAVLDEYRNRIYTYMPVPGGYGKSSLDYLGFFHGRGFAIEAKRARKKPTARQDGIIEDIERGGAKVFRIDGDEGVRELRRWLEDVEVLAA